MQVHLPGHLPSVATQGYEIWRSVRSCQEGYQITFDL